MQLRGAVSLQLSAGNAIEGVRTVNTFEGVPDVPVTRFELNINGGKQGILKNFDNLCQHPDHADATFTAHSGRSLSFRPRLEVQACLRAAGRASISTKRARMSRRGVVPIKVSCAQGASCAGILRLKAGKRKLGQKRFSIAAGKVASVRVRLGRRARRLVRKRRRIGARAAITGNGSASKRITIRA